MLLIVGTIRLPPDNLMAARPVMARMVLASRAENGCEEYSYAEDVLDPGLIHVKEIWRDQAALDRHFASEHIATWRATWQELGIGERNLRVYEVGAPRST
ncbi:putative quinol monooxygenase [Mesorhizobium sp. KR1-2]|uniref:putative quinol monooxygenase n=1 Tax=Mesorhizobium sp. KR1-2 TaxID=3156609 RepID=UPI0032B3BA4E